MMMGNEDKRRGEGGRFDRRTEERERSHLM
jgi:hypothetical protein